MVDELTPEICTKFLDLLKKQDFATALPIVLDCLNVLHPLYKDVLDKQVDCPELEYDEYSLEFLVGGNNCVEWSDYVVKDGDQIKY